MYKIKKRLGKCGFGKVYVVQILNGGTKQAGLDALEVPIQYLIKESHMDTIIFLELVLFPWGLDKFLF